MNDIFLLVKLHFWMKLRIVSFLNFIYFVNFINVIQAKNSQNVKYFKMNICNKQLVILFQWTQRFLWLLRVSSKPCNFSFRMLNLHVYWKCVIYRFLVVEKKQRLNKTTVYLNTRYFQWYKISLKYIFGGGGGR